jgi:mannose-6-phosphate isomerase-like protein (cupin superfamily)
MNQVATRDRLYKLQEEMLKLPQAELPTLHFLIKPTEDYPVGLYARIVIRPADTTIIGRVHRHEHFYVVTKGHVAVVSDAEPIHYYAGDVIVSQPGTKRAVYSFEDSICMTVHRTMKTELAEIEVELCEPDEASPFTIGNKLKAICHS